MKYHYWIFLGHFQEVPLLERAWYCPRAGHPLQNPAACRYSMRSQCLKTDFEAPDRHEFGKSDGGSSVQVDLTFARG